MRSEHMCY